MSRRLKWQLLEFMTLSHPWQVHLSGRFRDIWYLIWQLGGKVQQVQDGAGAFGGRGNGRNPPRQLLFMS
jgi:hypothetical protein